MVAWQQVEEPLKKFRVAGRNRTHELRNAGRMLQPLSSEIFSAVLSHVAKATMIFQRHPISHNTVEWNWKKKKEKKRKKKEKNRNIITENCKSKDDVYLFREPFISISTLRKSMRIEETTICISCFQWRATLLWTNFWGRKMTSGHIGHLKIHICKFILW